MKSRRFKRRKQDNGSPKWMNTYADMITLVLVFFILLFSISQIDAQKFKTVAESYRDRVIFDFNPSIIPETTPAGYGDEMDNQDGPLEVMNPNELADEKDIDNPQDDEQGNKEDSLANLIEEIRFYLKKEGLTDVITANRTERGVVLVLQEDILFDSGKAILIEKGKAFLDKVGKLLHSIPNHVKVEGHTDSRSISTYRFPSNWELSGARASSVIRYLIENQSLDSTRFQSSGFADTRPIAKNDSPENMQKNRRVEIIILEPES